MDQFIAFFSVEEVSLTLLPVGFEGYQHLYQIGVILQLRVHDLYIIVVFLHQFAETLKCLFDFLSQGPHRLTLTWRDPPNDPFRCRQDFYAEVISTSALRIRYAIDLTNNFYQFRPCLVVLVVIHHNFSFDFFFVLQSRQRLLHLDCFGE